jgi:hypothetical protein
VSDHELPRDPDEGDLPMVGEALDGERVSWVDWVDPVSGERQRLRASGGSTASNVAAGRTSMRKRPFIPGLGGAQSPRSFIWSIEIAQSWLSLAAGSAA